MGEVGDRPHLLGRVERAHLGGLRDAHGERLRSVLVAPAPRLAGNQLRRELAVRGRHREQLDAGHPLGGAGLVGVDVRGRRRDDGAPARQHAGQRDDVRTRAVEDGERLGVLAEVLADHLLQAGGVPVLPVRDLVAAVRRGDRSEHLGVHAGVVVAREAAPVGVVEGGDRHFSIFPAGSGSKAVGERGASGRAGRREYVRGGLRPARVGRLPTSGLAVLAPRPTAGPALAFVQLLLRPSDASLSGHLLLGILDPTDELVARQGRDVLLGSERRAVGDQRLAEVCRQLVHHAAGHSLAAHAARVTPVGQIPVAPMELKGAWGRAIGTIYYLT